MKGDRDLARKFWNEHGPLTQNHSQPNWTSDRTMPNKLSRLRKAIKGCGGRPELVEPVSRPVITTANSTNSVNPSTPVMPMDQAVPLPESKALPAPDQDHQLQDPGAATFPPSSVNPADLVNVAPTISPPPAPNQDSQDPAVLGAAIFRPNSPPSKNLFNGHPLIRVSDHFSQSTFSNQIGRAHV